jgi:hypothetical protein
MIESTQARIGSLGWMRRQRVRSVERSGSVSRLVGWLAGPGDRPMDPSNRVMNIVCIYFIIIDLSLNKFQI